MVRPFLPTACAALVALAVGALVPAPAAAFDEARPAAASPAPTFSERELIEAGHAFFGETTTGLGSMLANLLSRFGEPTGYILGEEGSGAVFAGLRYGEGTLHTQHLGTHRLFWQGPSLGWDLGASGSRVMMLVYKMGRVEDVMQRFTGVDGSAYIIGGVSMTVMAADDMVLIPVRTGVGARLGASLGYLKLTRSPTWNPF